MDTFSGSLVQSCCGEGETLQRSITGVCGERAQCLSHTGFAPAHGVCAFPVYTAQALGYSAGNCLRPALGCTHFPGLSRSGQVLRYSTKAQTQLGLRFVPFPGPSSSGDQELGAVTATYHLPHPCHSVFWVYNQHTFSGVPCVYSGELVSGCDPPSGCQPSRIPRSLS